jgi:hypothetical protein
MPCFCTDLKQKAISIPEDKEFVLTGVLEERTIQEKGRGAEYCSFL